jgi:FixJ family two-component response regulator
MALKSNGEGLFLLTQTEAKKCGAVGFLTKPFGPAQLTMNCASAPFGRKVTA